MIYWLKKLEWKIRKALGLHKRPRSVTITFEVFFKLALVGVAIIVLIDLVQALAWLWGWLFPRIIKAPMEYL